MVTLELVSNNWKWMALWECNSMLLFAGGMSAAHQCNSCYSRWHGIPSPPQEWDYESRVDWCIWGKCCR